MEFLIARGFNSTFLAEHFLDELQAFEHRYHVSLNLIKSKQINNEMESTLKVMLKMKHK